MDYVGGVIGRYIAYPSDDVTSVGFPRATPTKEGGNIFGENCMKMKDICDASLLMDPPLVTSGNRCRRNKNAFQ